MSLLGKLMDTMRLSDEEYDDDYYLDEDYEDDKADKTVKKGLFGKREEDNYDDEEMDGSPKNRFLSRTPKVVPMKRNMEVSMIKPTSMEDGKAISDYLLSGKAVVLNMEGIHMELAQRIIDFTSGATYSINGNLQKISNFIFIATPDSVSLSGDFQDLISGAQDVPEMRLRI